MSQDSFIYFVVNMADEPSCRASLKRFQLLVPGLCQALKRVCPRPLLTQRETAIWSVGPWLTSSAGCEGGGDLGPHSANAPPAHQTEAVHG